MTTSASATSASSSSAVAREAPWCTTTRRPGVKRADSAAQLPTTAGGAITSTGPSPTVRAMWASTVGVLPSPMSSARQPPSSAASRNAEPGQRLGLIAPQLAGEAVGPRDGFVGPIALAPAASRAPRPSPLRSSATRRRTADASRPRPRRRISAPVSCVVVARSASAAAASFRSTRSSSTHRPRALTRGRASAASRAISAAVSSTSSNTTDQRTLLSWWAPTSGLARRNR